MNMKNNKVVVILSCVIFAMCMVLVYLFVKHKQRMSEGPAAGVGGSAPKKGERPCPVEKEITVDDAQMFGPSEKGKKLRLLENWYDCHPLKAGELVYYRYSRSKDPVVRVLAAIPGDHFSLVKDSKASRWNLKVNGRLVKDSGGGVYFFGNAHAPLLSLYEKSNKGLLSDGNAIVFSRHPPGSLDSGMFGVVDVQDLLGKIETP
jgi:hypothetical protein